MQRLQPVRTFMLATGSWQLSAIAGRNTHPGRMNSRTISRPARRRTPRWPGLNAPYVSPDRLACACADRRLSAQALSQPGRFERRNPAC